MDLIEAVLFDLDDTLYPQRDWLRGAWEDVADAAASLGADRVRVHEALERIAAEGSDRGRIIDRALEAAGAADVPVEPLVAAFLDHRPASLSCYPDAAETVAAIRRLVPVALVTDGDPELQRAKIALLGLGGAFDAVVLSDELGREFRKPHPEPFRRAVGRLGIPASQAVMVGDRPDKDVAGAAVAGLRAVRVLTGEYAGTPDEILPWRTVDRLTDLAEVLGPHLPTAAARGGFRPAG